MAYRKSTTTTTSSVSSTAIAAIQKLFAEAKAMYAPGGALQAGTEAGIERGRKKAVTGGMQYLAGMGLAGTSMAGGLSKKYEEEVAMPTRARSESSRLTALSGLMQSQAGAYAQLAPRTTRQTTTTPYSPPSMSAPPPRRISATPTSRQATQTAPTAQQTLPSVGYQPKKKAPKMVSSGVYFGKAFYDQQKSPTSSFYGDFQATAPKTTSPVMGEFNKYR